MEACGRSLCTRKPEKHICNLRCFEKCPDCHYPVRWKLQCGHQVTLQCHQDPKTHKCVEPVQTLLPCGHTEMKPCHVRLEDFACPVDCKATLDCGHVCMQKCHDRKDPDHLLYECHKPCAKLRAGCSTKEHYCRKLCHEECEPCTAQVKKHRTICTHVFEVSCNSNVDELTCEKPCKRNLPCGHQCKNKCCDTCGPCEVKVEKVIDACGHKLTVKCCEEPRRQECRQKCERRLTCGHACVELCKMACTVKCEEMVACRLQSPCGHVIETIKCFERPFLNAQVLPKYCSVPCLATLQCEHKCGGTCGQCFQGRVHARCQERCGVPMVCNHECPIPCREACRPCEKKCTYKCIHGRCTKKCGEVCVPCAEVCSRKCAHQKCDRKCSEICSVKPCTEPCPKMLKCRHQCVGFCGDPCPKLCRVCDRKELTEILFGTEDEEDARFVQLKDCGHVLESDGMEMWLKGENEDEIQVKVCPKCKTQIVNTQRYSEHLKRAFVDIQNVKQRLNGSPEANRDTRLQLLKRILLLKQHSMSRFSTLFSSTLKETESRLEETKLDVVRGRVRQYFNAVILNSITSKVQILEHIAKICVSVTEMSVSSDTTSEIRCQLSFILDCIQRDEVQVTNQEIDDIQMEISRLKRIVELTQIKKKFGYVSLESLLMLKLRSPSVTPAARIQRIEELVNLRQRYTKDIDEKIQELMRSLRSGIQISESERVEIVKALGLKQGHWFKCPNGHPYVITECGGAMQEYTCPEAGCGEKIGGTRHTLIGTNQLASEMDGARFAAYSNMANDFGNYDM
ncbi:unnamed protein product [Phaedon cochleariae]|uniref:RZ-type domain-containing protein n=1 Tax=Phaedon cochleariae TaxID=80249 RepID=A0A9N9SF38_PHACE|nr:unnamed protein product [Phaedon cochleariae]